MTRHLAVDFLDWVILRVGLPRLARLRLDVWARARSSFGWTVCPHCGVTDPHFRHRAECYEPGRWVVCHRCLGIASVDRRGDLVVRAADEVPTYVHAAIVTYVMENPR